MKKIALLLGLALFAGCAGADYRGEFHPRACVKVPVGIEQFQYMDPSLKEHKISCAVLARCARIMGLSAPPNVPCE